MLLVLRRGVVRTLAESQREHGKECTPVTAASIGRKDQEPDTKHNGDDMVSTEANTIPNPDRGFVTSRPDQPMRTATSTCQNKSHHECSTGHGIADDGSAPCVGNTSMTPGITSGAPADTLKPAEHYQPEQYQAVSYFCCDFHIV